MDAYAKSKTPESMRDRRSTPSWVYGAICAATGLDPIWDVCAEPHTSVVGDNMPRNYWTAEDDALLLDWHYAIRNQERQILPVAWMNPPYSDPGAWCEKAATESREGMIVVGLLPDDRSTVWYQRHIHGIAPTVFLTPTRIPFVNPETGKEQAGNPKGSIVPIWTPWRTGQTTEVYIDRDLWDARKSR